MDFPVTVESQADFDELVKERLARETRKQEELQTKLDETTAQKDALEKGASEQDVALQEAAAQARAEAAKAYADVLRAAEVRAVAAALRFNDPMDALAAIGDLSDIEVTDDNEVDAEVIRTRLGEIAEKKPYLIAASEDYTFEDQGGLGKKSTSDPLAGKTGVDLMASAIDANKE